MTQRGALWRDLLGAGRARSAPLDGLRGLAVLIVIASHWSNAGLDLLPVTMAGTGKSGVYLFFVLSAFLLTRLMLLRWEREGASRSWLLADYAFRRVLRIWPLYLVILLVSFACTQLGWTAWHYAPMDLASLRGHVLLQRGDSVLWSIPVEFTFYLVLPLLVVAMHAARTLPMALQALAAALLIAAASAAWPPTGMLENDIRLGPYLVLFLCGAFSARLDLWLGRRGQGHAAWAWLAIAMAGALVASHPVVWSAAWGTPPNAKLNHTWLPFFGVCWSALLLAAVRGPAWLAAIFSTAALRVLGAVSFSAYLWHMPVLDWLAGLALASRGLAAWLGVAIVVLVSLLSWALIERPWQGLRLGRKDHPDTMRHH